MSDTAELLKQLRDVQEPLPPEGVSFWLIAANVAVAIIILTLLFYRKHRAKTLWRKQLIRDIRRIKHQYPEQAVHHMAIALRQLLLSRGQQVNTLSGTSWLSALDNHFSTQWFTQQQGKVFGDALYRQENDHNTDLDNIVTRLESLIKSLPSQPNIATVES